MIEVRDHNNFVRIIANDYELIFPEHDLFVHGKYIGKFAKYEFSGRLIVTMESGQKW